MSNVSALSTFNDDTSDTDSGGGSGWQASRRRRRPNRGSNTLVFYKNGGSGKRNGDDEDGCSGSAESDCNNTDYGRGKSQRGRGTAYRPSSANRSSDSSRGRFNSRKPFAGKLPGRGRGSNRPTFTDNDRDGFEQNTDGNGRANKSRISNGEVAKGREDNMSKNDRSCSRNSRPANGVNDKQSDALHENGKLKPQNHPRNLPPRLQRKFGLIAASTDPPREKTTPEKTVSGKSDTQSSLGLDSDANGANAAASAAVEVEHARSADSNVAEAGTEESVVETNRCRVSISGAAKNEENDAKRVMQTNFWKERQEFYRGAIPDTEDKEQQMVRLAVEASEKEMQKKRLMQAKEQEEMEQIKHIICKEGLEGFTKLTPDIRNGIFNAVQSQLNNEPVAEKVYMPTNLPPVGTKCPPRPTDKSSEVFSQLVRIGRSPHICSETFSDENDNSIVKRDQTIPPITTIKDLVYPPIGQQQDDVFHIPDHSSLLFAGEPVSKEDHGSDKKGSPPRTTQVQLPIGTHAKRTDDIIPAPVYMKTTEMRAPQVQNMAEIPLSSGSVFSEGSFPAAGKPELNKLVPIMPTRPRDIFHDMEYFRLENKTSGFINQPLFEQQPVTGHQANQVSISRESSAQHIAVGGGAAILSTQSKTEHLVSASRFTSVASTKTTVPVDGNGKPGVAESTVQGPSSAEQQARTPPGFASVEQATSAASMLANNRTNNIQFLLSKLSAGGGSQRSPTEAAKLQISNKPSTTFESSASNSSNVFVTSKSSLTEQINPNTAQTSSSDPRQQKSSEVEMFGIPMVTSQAPKQQEWMRAFVGVNMEFQRPFSTTSGAQRVETDVAPVTLPNLPNSYSSACEGSMQPMPNQWDKLQGVSGTEFKSQNIVNQHNASNVEEIKVNVGHKGLPEKTAEVLPYCTNKPLAADTTSFIPDDGNRSNMTVDIAAALPSNDPKVSDDATSHLPQNSYGNAIVEKPELHLAEDGHSKPNIPPSVPSQQFPGGQQMPHPMSYMPGYPSVPGYPPMSGYPAMPMGPMPYYPQWPSYYPPMPMMMPMPMMPMPYWQPPGMWPRMGPGMMHPMMHPQFPHFPGTPAAEAGDATAEVVIKQTELEKKE